MEGMQRKNMYFPPPIWERLVTLSEREGVAIADVLRRLLSDALGINDEIMAQVELEAAEGDPVPKLRRDVIRQRIDHSKLAQKMTWLEIDRQEQADADAALVREIVEAQRLLHEGLKDLRQECDALRHGIEQLATVCVDLLRRVRATELGGEPPAEALHAIERGERWLNALEADILAKTGATERGQHE